MVLLNERIDKLESDMLYWKKSHIKLQEQHIRLQQKVSKLKKKIENDIP